MRHILLIEDNPDDIYFLAETFESLLPDVALKVAKHGDEAIAYLSGRGLYANRREYPIPSEVILDLGVPHQPGLEVLEWVRSHPTLGRLPVIVLSGSQRRADFERVSNLGIDGFFWKPVDFRQLATFVSSPSGRTIACRGGFRAI
jgi:CheY-like chemotaxis protein